MQPFPSRERGRPREFDTDLALDNAMTVFREKGFHAASVSDLSQAMNLTAGSIYKAFTDKRTLFLNVFERYTSLRNAQLRHQIEGLTTGRERIAEVLRFYLKSSHEIEGRRGCLVVAGTVELLTFDNEVATLVRQAITRNKAFLTSLIEQGQHDGSVSATLDPDAASMLMLYIVLGMRVAGKVENNPDGDPTLELALKILD
ncbi:TetR/AcrR family transcriptional regulator [Rahnella bonaserana]|jgi:TetR/AcrR family transcriptional regulator, transcriptional repressor for nem operon|uniref:TetR/AcrR family transcriptional regulator n=1 Tax=Rahnella bonaserana TaxID=2816248 RepID=UPI0024C44DAF|nr:TetR/AcrR family transcriptional regulator [Rahnella bonaserana]MCL9643889.1 TetR/AcrR family transcriptional regulator [Rahnella victoriana]WHZ42697.1 TetR/AcrR family transcriptional regulator [Rahnella bonaserana]